MYWLAVPSSCASWADLQSMHGFCCYDNIVPKAKCQRVLVLALCLVTVSMLHTQNITTSLALSVMAHVTGISSQFYCLHILADSNYTVSHPYKGRHHIFTWNFTKYCLIFTARRSYASAVLGVVILSVCPSHACFVTNPKNLPAIFLYHMKGNPSSFLLPNSGWWAMSPST